MIEKPASLRKLREQIDKEDRLLLDHLARRFSLAAEIASEKRRLARPLRDCDREREMFADRVAWGVHLRIDASLVERLFRLVVGHSVRLQHRSLSPRVRDSRRIGLCGAGGVDPEPAVSQHFSAAEIVELLRFEDPQDLLRVLADGQLDAGVLPLVAADGTVVTAAVDALSSHPVTMVAEERVPSAVEVGSDRERGARYAVVAGSSGDALDDDSACTCFVVAPAGDAGGVVRFIGALDRLGVGVRSLDQVRGSKLSDALLLVLAHGAPLRSPLREALPRLRAQADFLRVLGSFPVYDEAVAAPSPRPLTAGPPAVAGAITVQMAGTKPKGYRLAARDGHRETTVVNLGASSVGDGSFTVIAGPCAVESEEQIRACAAAVRRFGGSVLRGGVFKPRTSPYSFQGMGYPALMLLRDAAHDHSLLCVTEVMTPGDVERVQETADMLQIGARNMQNYPLLREVGKTRRPVLLKRGLAATIDEWLFAAEYVLNEGNQRVILCERGIRTFSSDTRFTLDVAAVPVLQERTHLPVIVDPSHAAGDWRYVAPLARAGRAVGCHGLMVEIHPDPPQSLSDRSQALSFDQFGELMLQLGMVTEAAPELKTVVSG